MPERKWEVIAKARDAIIFIFGEKIGLTTMNLFIVFSSTWKDTLWNKWVYPEHTKIKDNICCTYGRITRFLRQTVTIKYTCIKTKKTIGYCSWYKNLCERVWIFLTTVHGYRYSMSLIHNSYYGDCLQMLS